MTVPRSARGCRGAGFAVGALVAGMAADLPGLAAATWLVAGLTGIGGLILAAAGMRRSVAAEPDAGAGRLRSCPGWRCSEGRGRICPWLKRGSGWSLTARTG